MLGLIAVRAVALSTPEPTSTDEDIVTKPTPELLALDQAALMAVAREIDWSREFGSRADALNLADNELLSRGAALLIAKSCPSDVSSAALVMGADLVLLWDGATGACVVTESAAAALIASQIRATVS